MSYVRQVQEGNLIVFLDEENNVDHIEEVLTDEECDRYAVEIMNGDGYYNSNGHFVRYSGGDD